MTKTFKICQEQTLMAIKLMWEDLFAAQLFYLDGTLVQVPNKYGLLHHFLPYLISNIVFSGLVRTLAGNGRQGFKNGVGSDARFNYPEGIYFDTDHKVLYVVEFVSSLVTVHEQVQNKFKISRYGSSATTCVNRTGKSTT